MVQVASGVRGATRHLPAPCQALQMACRGSHQAPGRRALSPAHQERPGSEKLRGRRVVQQQGARVWLTPSAQRRPLRVTGLEQGQAGKARPLSVGLQSQRQAVLVRRDPQSRSPCWAAGGFGSTCPGPSFGHVPLRAPVVPNAEWGHLITTEFSALFGFLPTKPMVCDLKRK